MNTSINASMGASEWFMLLMLSILWGGSFFFIGVLVDYWPPLTIVALRVGLAALALWGITLAMGQRPPPRLRIWPTFLGMGLLNNVIPFSLIVWGQTEIGSGLASIFNATTPLFTVIVAGLLLADERANARKLIGVLIGFTGVVVMIGLPADSQEGTMLAQSAILAAALSYAFAGVYGRRFKAMGVSPVVAAAGQVTASFALLCPVTLAVDGVPTIRGAGLSAWAAIGGLALLSTALAYLLYFRLLASAGATNLLLVTLLIPVTAILLGALFLDETLSPIHFLGMALIALGLSAIDGRLWRRRHHHRYGQRQEG